MIVCRINDGIGTWAGVKTEHGKFDPDCAVCRPGLRRLPEGFGEINEVWPR